MQFRQTIINTVATVKGLYYELIYSIDNLAAAQKSLELAKKLLEENEIRVKVGTMAPLDVVSAQSEVASREEGVIVADNALSEAEDNLKRTLFPLNDPAMWSTRIVPTDRPSAEPVPVDIDAAVRNALETRTDVVAARKSLERSDYNVQYTQNQLLPQLDLVANYGGTGAGGTQLIRDLPSGARSWAPIPGGYGDALERGVRRRLPDVDGRREPLLRDPQPQREGLRGVRAAVTRTRRSPRSAGWSCRWRPEVRTAARGVESGFKRVASTQAARRLAAQRLDAEEQEVRRGHVDELPRHPGPARPRHGRGQRAAGDLRLPQERHQLPARAGGRRVRHRRGGRPRRQLERRRRPARRCSSADAASGQ